MKGMTLIELIIILALTSLIYAGVGSTFSITFDRFQSKQAVATLSSALKKSRLLAINQGRSVTLCPLKNGVCVGDWNNPLTIFFDRNLNRSLDPAEEHILTTGDKNSHGYWITRSNTQYHIRYSPEGHTYGFASTFVYCPNSEQYKFAKQVIVNMQGRIRYQNYLSNRGTPYSRLGSLTCN